jgi:Rrf2 family protein
MIDLARFSTDEPVSISAIATRQDISERYLEQLVALLKKSNLVESVRGAGGGYTLSKDPQEISVGMILRALEGNLEPVRCKGFSEQEECPLSGSCVSKLVWFRVNESINKAVDEIYLSELVEESIQISPEGSFVGAGEDSNEMRACAKAS